MKNLTSKIAVIFARTWAIPRMHKLIIAGVVAVLAATGLEIDTGTVEAIGTVLMIANEVMQ